MKWKRRLAYISGSVDQELPRRNEYLATENRILRNQIPGRPTTDDSIEELILKMARENRSWGYRRIVGALTNVGHEVSHQTVANILERHGLLLVPDRERKTSWRECIRSHTEVLATIVSIANDRNAGESFIRQERDTKSGGAVALAWPGIEVARKLADTIPDFVPLSLKARAALANASASHDRR